MAKKEELGAYPVTDDARETNLINLAMDCAEEQMRNGTASSQVITHYLKLGSTRERLEKEMLKSQIGKLQAQIEALQSAKRVEELYSDAIEAFRQYNGYGVIDDEDLQ